MTTNTQMNIGWLPPETAPRTGEMILADIGFPWPCLVCWNKHQEEWVFASLCMNFVYGVEDPYFETDYDHLQSLKRWLPLPDLDK